MRKPVKDYALAVTVSDYIDLRLLDVLRNQFRGKVLLNGRLDMDAYARRQEAVLPVYLVKNKLQLKSGPVRKAGNLSGKLIGHTGENTPNYWMVSREYTIPGDITKFGGNNELVVIVRNLRDDAGIWKAPVEISGSAAGVAEFSGGGKTAVPCGDMTSLIVPEQLAEGTEILARFHLPGSREPKVAFVRQGRFFWYFSDREFCKANPSDRHVLDTVLVPQR